MIGNVKTKRIAKDVLLNIAASFLANAVLQFLVYPFLSREFSADMYGRMLLLTGIATMLSQVLGTTLNNARLVVDLDYEKKGLLGDFNLLFVISEVIAVIGAILTVFFVDNNLNAADTLGIVIMTVLGTAKAYYSVGYRLLLNFKKILIQNVFYFVGGTIGLIICIATHSSWLLPFILAEAFACVYIFCTIKLHKEPWKRTKYFGRTSKIFAIYAITGLMANLVIYLDRFLLYPILGGTDVAIYTTAAFFGKSLGLVMTPLAGVILSYYAKQARITTKSFLKQSGVLMLLCAAFYWISITGIAAWITGILYPTLIQAALPYIWIANLSAVVLVAGNMMSPAILKYCSAKLQPLIQGIHMVAYFGLGIWFVNAGGLMGFCIAALAANIIRIVVMLLVGIITFRRGDKQVSLAEDMK